MKALYLILALSSVLISHSNSQVLTRYNIPEEPSIGLVTALVIDNEDNKWVGTRNGLYKFDGTRWITYNRSDGLADSSITAIAVDSDGSIWFGTKSGVSKFDGTSWTTYNTSNGLISNYVTAIAADGNNVWIGTEEGISRFDGKIWQSYLPGHGKENRSYSVFDNISAIGTDNDGNVWFGAYNGIMKFDGDHWKKYFYRKRQMYRYTRKREMGRQGKFVWKGWYFSDAHSIVCDPEGNLWFGRLMGVLTYDGKRWTPIYFRKGDMAHVPIAVDKYGNKWFGCDYYLQRYDGIKWDEFKILSHFEDHPLIWALDIDSNGDLWMGISWENWVSMGRNGGIIKFNVESAGIK